MPELEKLAGFADYFLLFRCMAGLTTQVTGISICVFALTCQLSRFGLC